MKGLVSTTFTLEQKSGFKLERNKDLIFIVIIIDIDRYEKNYSDNFWGHIAQPYICMCANCQQAQNKTDNKDKNVDKSLREQKILWSNIWTIFQIKLGKKSFF